VSGFSGAWAGAAGFSALPAFQFHRVRDVVACLGRFDGVQLASKYWTASRTIGDSMMASGAARPAVRWRCARLLKQGRLPASRENAELAINPPAGFCLKHRWAGCGVPLTSRPRSWTQQDLDLPAIAHRTPRGSTTPPGSLWRAGCRRLPIADAEGAEKGVQTPAYHSRKRRAALWERGGDRGGRAGPAIAPRPLSAIS